ncbi:MAG: energy transducer TonB, partial [Bacteroidota bacterium]
YTMDRYEVYKEPVQKKQTVVKKQVITDVIKTAPDDGPEAPLKDLVTHPEPDKPALDPGQIDDPEPVETDIHINQVEKLPIFPGCERYTARKDLHKCMSQKINKLVQKKFNTDIAGEKGLSGKQKIYVQFKIDKTGNVSEIKARAPHPDLEKEAQRVINKIPQMQPGDQGLKPVNVVYNLPIIFQVRD